MVMVLPSDHFIGRRAPASVARSSRAVEAAKTRPIATIGITPTRPETGYGYIEKGAPIGDEAFEVKQFIEKPDLAHAETYVMSGKHLWNGGMFFFRARSWPT